MVETELRRVQQAPHQFLGGGRLVSGAGAEVGGDLCGFVFRGQAGEDRQVQFLRGEAGVGLLDDAFGHVAAGGGDPANDGAAVGGEEGLVRRGEEIALGLTRGGA